MVVGVVARVDCRPENANAAVVATELVGEPACEQSFFQETGCANGRDEVDGHHAGEATRELIRVQQRLSIGVVDRDENHRLPPSRVEDPVDQLLDILLDDPIHRSA